MYVPEELESIGTLPFLEFVPGAVSVVWNILLQRRQNDPHRADIVGEARKHISACEDATLTDDDWIGAMEAMGLARFSEARLMDPHFNYVRLSTTLCTRCLTCDTTSYSTLTMS